MLLPQTDGLPCNPQIFSFHLFLKGLMLDQKAVMQGPFQTSRPSILCLHGGGTTREIFDCQTSRMQRALHSHFDFVFVDGSFASPPGPGVLPFFADCGPYRAWETPNTTQSATLPSETANSLSKVFQDCEAAGNAIVGVMGFSQGARVATGLLSCRQHKQFSSLKFGVLLNGSYPAMLPSPELCSLGEISVPTVHVHGLLDQFLPQSRMLLDDHFSSSPHRLLNVRTGHHVVSKEVDVKLLADAIPKIWEAASRSTTLAMPPADFLADPLNCAVS